MTKVPVVVLAGCLAIGVVLLGAALVRVENERYALSTGLCVFDATNLKMYDCLRTVETRTAWWWHIFYALRG
jgi:hypothetical protein